MDHPGVRSYTYGEVHRMAERLAALFASYGVTPGNRLVVMEGNTPAFLLTQLASLMLGSVLVPLHPSYTREECEFIFQSTKPALIVCHEAYEQYFTDVSVPVLTTDESTVDALAQSLTERVASGEPSGGTVRSEPITSRLNACLPTLAPRAAKVEDVIEIMFTSGTTSSPKGVMLTEGNFTFSGLYVAWELSMSTEERYATSMSVAHVNFQLSALAPVVATGASLILLEHYSASRFISQLASTKATLVQGMAMIVRTLLRQKPSGADLSHHVRLMHYFLPISAHEKETFERRFGMPLLNNYGSTETLVGTITDYPDASCWPSIGKAGPGYQVRIVDADDREVGVNTCGEILVRGEPGWSLMAGYWRHRSATQAALREDGWYRTGDWGYKDEDGWIYFSDRRKDLIKRAGENVSPSEVEDVLATYPGVREVVVLGVSDPIRDHAIKAVLTPEEGAELDPHALATWAGEHLACFKVPTMIEIREELPRGQYGKVLREQLRSRAEDSVFWQAESLHQTTPRKEEIDGD